ncbi:MAG: FecR family protein [Gammaproteobacteria bacterium]|nr:FecR family protein [Gammaproteobacteria bacterium]MDH5213455.1 FecR family protein [Gammaproteobacteria bacterium]
MRKSALAVLLSLSAIAAFAQDAGTVIFATGSVTAERKPPVALSKGDAVRVQDTIATADASRAQLLMIDGARIALRPNSRLKIDEYSYSEAAPGNAVTTSSDRGVSSLLKGGFRTITGAIGKQDEKDYEVRTAVGVLGIRGTDYTAVFCNADCDWAPGVAAGQPLEDGLYLGVTEGVIVFRNENGDIELMAGQYAFVPLSNRVLKKLAIPPSVLLDNNDLSLDATGSGQQSRPSGASAPGFDSKLGTRRSPSSNEFGIEEETSEGKGGRDAPEQSVIGVNPDGTPVDITPGTSPPPNGQRTISWATGPAFGPSTLYSGTLDNDPTRYRLDVGNNLNGFANEIPGRTGLDVATFDIATSSNVNTGFDSVTVLRWGRWSGGTAGITLSDGSDASIDLASQSLHWVSGPESTSAPLMPVSGVANYSLVGNTNPTDNFGNVGVLGSATFTADFTNMLVDTTLQIDINSANWMAAGQGTIGMIGNQPVAPHIFGGSYNSVVIDGITGGGGNFSGFFSDPGPTSDPGFPGGAGMTFSIQDGSDTTQVSGALVFGNP